jgi:SAM-dependent methyltransferase
MMAAGSPHDFYLRLYASDFEQEAAWLDATAPVKVRSVRALLARHHLQPASVLELGCGVGAVIRECRRSGIGSSHTAIDYSPEAISFLQARAPEIRSIVADLTSPTFSLDADHFDLVLIPHVLEHLDDPAGFLRVALERIPFRHLIAEVPLEDLLAARIKNRFRDRRKNSAGHVQFFTAATFHKLLTSSGLEIIDTLTYAPVLSRPAMDFARKRNGWRGPALVMRSITQRYAPMLTAPIFKRLYHAHCAVLCRKL